jgi:glycerophosphoryl diester phosphodiesterase
MNKYLKILCIFLLAGCASQKDDVDFFLRIDASRQIQNFTSDAGHKLIPITANCTVETNSSQEWCIPVISDDVAGNLRITVAENTSTEARTATVSISSTEVKQIINITVHQAGVIPAVSVNTANIKIKNEILDFTLDVTANIPIIFDKPAWITEQTGNTWETGTKTYVFEASPLPALTLLREGDIVIKPAGTAINMSPISVHVTQRFATQVIAHRGYWDKAGASQNSLASLNNAIELGVYGSELDVWITSDNVLVLNHDATYGGVNIENSPYSVIAPLRLSNGEPLPTLQQCIDIVKQQTQSKKTKLIIEIKTHSNNANNKRCVDAVVAMVNNSGAADLVDYIAFSSYVCEELIKSNPQHRVAYLNGNLTPAALKSAGYWGLDYERGVLSSNTTWVNQAKEAGLTTNVWTVNNDADMRYFINMDIDFITTDQPLTLQRLLEDW